MTAKRSSAILLSAQPDLVGTCTSGAGLADTCATDVSYRPPFPLLGLGGVDLRKEWEEIPASYLGVGLLVTHSKLDG